MSDRIDDSPIHELARDGDLPGVRGELLRGLSVDLRHPESSRTALMEAAASPKAGAALVQLLIDHGADVNASSGSEKQVAQMKQFQELRERLLSDESLQTPGLDSTREMMRRFDAKPPPIASPSEISECVLSLALGCGDLEKVRALLDAGANATYRRAHGYDALIDAMHSHDITGDPRLLPVLELLVARGAPLSTITTYSESALRVASHMGRFDAVRLLLEAGADPAPLQWTPLLRAVALGSLDDVRSQVASGEDLAARDFWSRTPWLLSLQTGDVAKAQFLLSAGASRTDVGRCGWPPLKYPIANRHYAMLQWLLAEGFEVDAADEFGGTPLIDAAERGDERSVQLLLNAGADIHRTCHDEPAIKRASGIEVIRLLVKHGADLNDISDEVRVAITKLPHDGKLPVSLEQYLAEKHRRFGDSNPQRMNLGFWRAMITSGLYASQARRHFRDPDWGPPAVWCFKRYGKSINELPDGRIIEIAGEHEDHYDPDFCIYNDVVVHHGDGTFDLYGYPEAIFPPTDFHSATLVGDWIYILGNLGYPADRRPGTTQVFRLDTVSLQIERLSTSGEGPGWINRHKAVYDGRGTIRIQGGRLCAMEDGVEQYRDNTIQYELDLHTLIWRRA